MYARGEASVVAWLKETRRLSLDDIGESADPLTFPIESGRFHGGRLVVWRPPSSVTGSEIWGALPPSSLAADGPAGDDLERRVEQLVRFLRLVASFAADLERTKARIRKREADFQRLCEAMPDPLAIHAGGRLVYLNSAAVEKLGYASDDALVGQPIATVLHPDDLDLMRARVEHMSRTGETVAPTPERLLDRSGEPIDVEITAFPLEFRGRESFVAIARDVSQQRLIADALGAEKERLAVTLRSIGEPVITTDRYARVLMLNDAYALFSGAKPEEATMQPIEEVLDLRDANGVAPAVHPIRELLEAKAESSRVSSAILVDRTGAAHSVTVHATTIRDANGRRLGSVCIIRDLSDERAGERERARREKREALGVLAAGLSHDFNNVLTAVIANLSLARSFGDDHPERVRHLREAEAAALRARDLTLQLMTFAQGGSPVLRVASLEGVLRRALQAVTMTRATLFEIAVDEALWPVEIDASQLQQALTALVEIARESLPLDQPLRVAAHNGVRDDAMPQRFVELTIELDPETPNALELDAEAQPSIPGGRSDLALAAAHSIIRQHRGSIRTESRGPSSFVVIELPASTKPGAPMISDAPPTVGDRVLVMDDEAAIVHVFREILSRSGYRVDSADNGRDALEMHRRAIQSGDPYRVIVLDLTIHGGLGGVETIERLRETDQDVPVIASSGYFEDAVMANYADYGFSDVLKKPYSALELTEAIDRVCRVPRSRGDE
ncbi:MAG: PAS domain S-box protein [Myxococcales bacterium]|nr:PAS domain S-box protein [Myxococcales bacterium]